MMDEYNACLRKYKDKLQVAEPDLSYAKRSNQRKTLFAVVIPYPLLKAWHKLVRCETIEYIDLLEAIIPNGLFAFKDEETVRNEVNSNLAKISGSIFQLYKQTKGRARAKLDENSRKYHVFEEQIKTAEEFKAEMNLIQEDIELEKERLQEEVENWRSRYKNLEVEKRSLFDAMSKIILEKERVISHLQKSNQELEMS